jgi:hypothetical protein
VATRKGKTRRTRPRSARRPHPDRPAGKGATPGDRRAALKLVMVEARRAGATLKQAAARAGIHVATARRWGVADPAFLEAIRAAAWEYRCEVYAARPRRRPSVLYHPSCPECDSPAVVRTALPFRAVFWGCALYPLCTWASWRPRFPLDCLRCGGPQYWSHSRKSVGCDRCPVRISLP